MFGWFTSKNEFTNETNLSKKQCSVIQTDYSYFKAFCLRCNCCDYITWISLLLSPLSPFQNISIAFGSIILCWSLDDLLSFLCPNLLSAHQKVCGWVVVLWISFHIEGFWPEWYISTTYHCRNIPFLSETLNMCLSNWSLLHVKVER